MLKPNLTKFNADSYAMLTIYIEKLDPRSEWDESGRFGWMLYRTACDDGQILAWNNWTIGDDVRNKHWEVRYRNPKSVAMGWGECKTETDPDLIINTGLSGDGPGTDVITIHCLGDAIIKAARMINARVKAKRPQTTIVWTTAPVDYDGFGTETMRVVGMCRRTREPVRQVVIQDDAYEWQTTRYRSGGYVITQLQSGVDSQVRLSEWELTVKPS